MVKVKKQRVASTNNVAETKSLSQIKAVTGNLYESIAVIAKRANQINIAVKEELHDKLEEFVVHSDNLEEVLENKEQIEMSKLYERMPNPSLVATQEFLEGKVYFRKNDADLFH